MRFWIEQSSREVINMVTKEDAIIINDEAGLQYLIHRFNNGPSFAMAFVFENESLYTRFFEEVKISVEQFQEKYYYYNQDKNIHISESEFGFLWISTMGLVATSRVTKNKFVNAFLCQIPVLMHLLDDAITICNDEQIYDIDSHHYQMVEERTPALFHNLLFFSETLLKAYISLHGEKVPYTHKLETLLKCSKQIMFEKKQNNTIFHAYIIPTIEGIVSHISSLPGTFKEQYVKYDDNPNDTTLMAFRTDYFQQIMDFVRLSDDVISGMYYSPEDEMYLEQGLYERLLKKCETAEAREAVRKMYKFLVEDKEIVAKGE